MRISIELAKRSRYNLDITQEKIMEYLLTIQEGLESLDQSHKHKFELPVLQF